MEVCRGAPGLIDLAGRREQGRVEGLRQQRGDGDAQPAAVPLADDGDGTAERPGDEVHVQRTGHEQ
eukprot:scaffold671867_cov43-Prasinocladus_malaysianus.AAC.1